MPTIHGAEPGPQRVALERCGLIHHSNHLLQEASQFGQTIADMLPYPHSECKGSPCPPSRGSMLLPTCISVLVFTGHTPSSWHAFPIHHLLCDLTSSKKSSPIKPTSYSFFFVLIYFSKFTGPHYSHSSQYTYRPLYYTKYFIYIISLHNNLLWIYV